LLLLLLLDDDAVPGGGVGLMTLRVHDCTTQGACCSCFGFAADACTAQVPTLKLAP
jgi:hypothetical protein